MKGLLITFEGNEGGGKSTQIDRLTTRMRETGRSVLAVREPGGTPIGEEIRHTLKHSVQNQAMTPEAELLLMSASRAQLVREVIRPALSEGHIVLCDRFYDSTAVYQGYGRGLDLRFIDFLTDFVVGDTRPDLTLLLHVPPSVSLERRRQRQTTIVTPLRDRFEESDDEFFRKIDAGYLELARRNPERIKVVDATESIEKVASAIWAVVEPLVRKVSYS
jgi:dTMP kinase